MSEEMIREGVRVSAELGELAKALTSAQLEFKSIRKEQDNPYYNSKYADLANVIAATQAALAKHGIAIIQSPIMDLEHQRAGVQTLMVHSSGQWMSDSMMLPATMRAKEGGVKFDAQSVGSAITYARRYAYQAFVGVAAEVDDDANAASGHATETRERGTKEAAQKVADRKINEAEKKQEATGEPKLETISGVVMSVEQKETKPKKAGQLPRPFMALVVNGNKITEFDNAKLPVENGKTQRSFILLYESKGKPVTLIVERKGQYLNPKKWLRIGDRQWKADGSFSGVPPANIPDREPGEDQFDEETGLPL